MEGLRSWDLLPLERVQAGAEPLRPYHGCYIPGPGTYDMDNDGTPDLELFTEKATSACPTKLQIGKDVILSESTEGYIVGYPASSTAITGATGATTSGPSRRAAHAQSCADAEPGLGGRSQLLTAPSVPSCATTGNPMITGRFFVRQTTPAPSCGRNP